VANLAILSFPHLLSLFYGKNRGFLPFPQNEMWITMWKSV
jgi:hypothetical protein